MKYQRYKIDYATNDELREGLRVYQYYNGLSNEQMDDLFMFMNVSSYSDIVNGHRTINFSSKVKSFKLLNSLPNSAFIDYRTNRDVVTELKEFIKHHNLPISRISQITGIHRSLIDGALRGDTNFSYKNRRMIILLLDGMLAIVNPTESIRTQSKIMESAPISLEQELEVFAINKLLDINLNVDSLEKYNKLKMYLVKHNIVKMEDFEKLKNKYEKEELQLLLGVIALDKNKFV